MSVISMAARRHEYSLRAKKAWRTKRANEEAKLADYRRRAKKRLRTQRAS